MSVLIPKPFQPVKFSRYGFEGPWACVDNPCQSLGGERCGEYTIGGKFAPIVTPNDKFSAQIDIALCGDETQVLQNPNFEDGSDGLDNWEILNTPTPTVENDIVTISGAGGLLQLNVPNGTYYAVVNIVEIEGTASIGSHVVSTTGIQEFVVTVSLSTFVMSTFSFTDPNSTVKIGSIKLYQIAGEGDYDVEIYAAGDVPGTDSPAHTFTSAVGIDGTIMSVNFNWEDANLQDGYYFVSLAFECDGETYYLVSNDFQKLADPECTVLIWACIGTDGNGFQNASFFPNIRLKPYFFGPKYVTDREINTDTAGYTSIYYASTEKTKELQTQALPEWVLDWLGTLPSYNAIYIAGEYWTTQDDEIQPEPDDSFPNWGTVNIVFKLNNNPLQMVRCNEEIYCADPPDQGPNCWQWTDGDTIDWTDETCIELVN